MFPGFSVMLSSNRGASVGDPLVFSGARRGKSCRMAMATYKFAGRSAISMNGVPMCVRFAIDGIACPSSMIMRVRDGIGRGVAIELGGGRCSMGVIGKGKGISFSGLSTGDCRLVFRCVNSSSRFGTFGRAGVGMTGVPMALAVRGISSVGICKVVGSGVVLGPGMDPIATRLCVGNVFGGAVCLCSSVGGLAFGGLGRKGCGVALLVTRARGCFSTGTSTAFDIKECSPGVGIRISSIHINRGTAIEVSTGGFAKGIVLSVGKMGSAMLVGGGAGVTISGLRNKGCGVSILFGKSGVCLPSGTSTGFRIMGGGPRLRIGVAENGGAKVVRVDAGSGYANHIKVCVGFSICCLGLANNDTAFSIRFSDKAGCVFTFCSKSRGFEGTACGAAVVVSRRFIVIKRSIRTIRCGGFACSVILIRGGEVAVPGHGIMVTFGNRCCGLAAGGSKVTNVGLGLTDKACLVSTACLGRAMAGGVIIGRLGFRLGLGGVSCKRARCVRTVFSCGIANCVGFRIRGVARAIRVGNSETSVGVSDLGVKGCEMGTACFGNLVSGATSSRFRIMETAPGVGIGTGGTILKRSRVVRVVFRSGVTKDVAVGMGSSMGIIRVGGSGIVLGLSGLGIKVCSILIFCSKGRGCAGFACRASFTIEGRASIVSLVVGRSCFKRSVVVGTVLGRSTANFIAFAVGKVSGAMVIRGKRTVYAFGSFGIKGCGISIGCSNSFGCVPSGASNFTGIVGTGSAVGVIANRVALNRGVLVCTGLPGGTANRICFSVVNRCSPETGRLSGNITL